MMLDKYIRVISLLCLVSLVLLCLVGCGDAYKDGYKKGLADGYEVGYDEGKEAGATQTAVAYEGRWSVIGLPIGLIIGGALVALFTRRFIASEYGKWRRRRRVAALLAKCTVDLDTDLYERVLRTGLRKQKLEEELERADGKLVEVFHDRIHESLRAMNDSIVKVAGLMQQLMTIRDEVALDEEAVRKRIVDLEETLGRIDNVDEAIEIKEAIEIEASRIRAAARNEENIHRCDLKLTMLDCFLDNLIITVGNMRTIEEQDSFERFERDVSREVENLESVFENALASLFSPGNVDM